MDLLLLLSYKYVLPEMLSALVLIQYPTVPGCEQIFFSDPTVKSPIVLLQKIWSINKKSTE